MKPEPYDQVRDDRAADTTEHRIRQVRSEFTDEERLERARRLDEHRERATYRLLANATRAFLIVETEGTEIVDVVERADDRQSATGFLLQCARPPRFDLLCRTPDGSYRFASYTMPDVGEDNLTQLNRTGAGVALCNAAIYVPKSDWESATVKAANERIQQAYDALNLAAQVARVKELRRARYLLEAAESVLSAFSLPGRGGLWCHSRVHWMQQTPVDSKNSRGGRLNGRGP